MRLRLECIEPRYASELADACAALLEQPDYELWMRRECMAEYEAEPEAYPDCANVLDGIAAAGPHLVVFLMSEEGEEPRVNRLWSEGREVPPLTCEPGGLLPFYRFELYDMSGPLEGFIQGLEGRIRGEQLHQLTAPFDRLPLHWSDVPVECWFTREGVQAFADAILAVQAALEPLDLGLLAYTMEEEPGVAVFSDRYQAGFEREDISISAHSNPQTIDGREDLDELLGFPAV